MPAEDVQEPAADPAALELLAWVGTVLYWIVWPIAISLYYVLYYLALTILFVLKLLYRPLEFVLLPVFYLLRFLGACLLAPFQFLARFEVRREDTSNTPDSPDCSQCSRLYISTLALEPLWVALWDYFSVSSTALCKAHLASIPYHRDAQSSSTGRKKTSRRQELLRCLCHLVISHRAI